MLTTVIVAKLEIMVHTIHNHIITGNGISTNSFETCLFLTFSYVLQYILLSTKILVLIQLIGKFKNLIVYKIFYLETTTNHCVKFKN